MWENTRITELLRIKYPIILGPMAGGFSTPELVAAVSNAGGLGSLGAYTLQPNEILETARLIETKTSSPYNINLWVSDVDESLTSYSVESMEKVKTLFKPYFDELDIPFPDLQTNIPSKFLQQVEAVFQLKPAVFSFIFGIPSKDILDECRRLGIKTIGAATTLDEALLLEEAGVDAIVASGFEAGGHRPSFLKPALESLTGTFALIQQLKAKVKTPVIAAGGIANGRGIAAALTLGADAVQIGTAFLVTDESGAPPLHKEVLLSEEPKHTVLSKSLTGRFGRMIHNRISDEISNETAVLPFPLQTRLIAPLRAAAIKRGDTNMANFWSGQNTVNLRHTTTDALFRSLVDETSHILK